MNTKTRQTIEDPEENLESQEKYMRKVKQKLRRASLYGCGARTVLPRTKKNKESKISPYILPGGEEETLPTRPLTSSTPPVAHDDQYRIVTNNTQFSRNNPDRYFYNSSSMISSLPHNISTLSQPPWYMGYSNKINPPDNNSLISANRYGYRGALNHLKFTVPPYSQPSNTRHEYTPNFLVADENYIDEYVPKIMMGPLNSINGMETPKKWPENSEFVSGSNLKKLPSSFQYARETTVYLPEKSLLLNSAQLTHSGHNFSKNGIAIKENENNFDIDRIEENILSESSQNNLLSSSLYSSSSAGDDEIHIHTSKNLLNGINNLKDKKSKNILERPYTSNSTLKKLKNQSQIFSTVKSTNNLLEPLNNETKNLLLLEKQNEENKLLRTYKNLESKNLINNFPQQNLQKFKKTWSEIVTNEGTDLLKSTLNQSNSPNIDFVQTSGNNSLPKANNTIRYSGSSSILVQSNTTNEIKFQLRMKSNFEKVNLPYQLKWSHLYGHYYNINLKLKKNQNFLLVLLKIGKYFQYYSKMNSNNLYSLKRIDFIKLCSKNFYFEDVNSKLMSQLYSLYDPMKKNSMRYIEILLSLLILDCPNLNILKKLYIVFKFYSIFGFDKNIFEILTDILTLCCNNNKENDEIVHLIQTKYRLVCYEMAWKHYAGLNSNDPLYNNYFNISNSHLTNHFNTLNIVDSNVVPPSPSTTNDFNFSANNNNSNSTLNDDDFFDDPILKDEDFFNSFNSTSSSTSSPNSNHYSSLSSTSSNAFINKNDGQQYNICSEFLNPYTFVLTLRQCPELLEIFKKQLNSRIDKCYGRNDEKNLEKEKKKNSKDKFNSSNNEENEKDIDYAQKDFSWIMKKEAPKRQVFGLF